MIAPVLIAAAIGWVVLLIAAPALPAPIAAALYAAGSFICHQRPERSFHIDAAQLPVCARCFGIYAGAVVGAAAHLITNHGGTKTRSISGFRASVTPWFVMTALPTFITIALEVAGVWHPSNITRAIAGAPLGAAVAFVVTRALHYGECAPPRPTVSTRPPTPT